MLRWTLQILIVAAGIHLFLRFVRHTRGSRLIRGLYVAVLLGWVGLWGLSKPLGLDELEHILQGATGFMVLVFAIVFQPELRRGIAQLGERSFGGGLSNRSDPDVVRRVARAAKSMAARRHGALIAFEREMSLNTYVETGAQLDAEVSARLIETLFNPKGPLHDGAIVLRDGRIAAAGCFFPLPQEGEFDPSMGTRHRAALGLTEENDAIVLVVSEETGSISIAQEGTIRSNVTEDKLEDELHRILSMADSDRAERRRLLSMHRGTWRSDMVWLLASVLLASGILLVAHEDIRISKSYPLRVRGVGPTDTTAALDDELVVVLPAQDYRLKNQDLRVSVEVIGSNSQVDLVGDKLSGVYQMSPGDATDAPIDISRVQWKHPVFGLEYSWRGPVPQLELEPYESRPFTFVPAEVRVDARDLDPRYQVLGPVEIVGDPSLEVEGPKNVLDGLKNVDLEDAKLASADRSDRTFRLGLASKMRDLGLTIAPGAGLEVKVPIAAAEREIGVVNREIALVSMDPEHAADVEKWSLPAHAQTARFTIETHGLIQAGADPGSPAVRELFAAIKGFVEENLVVYVDVAELPEGGREVPVHWTWRKDWRETLQKTLDLGPAEQGDREGLDVSLESDKVVLLEKREETPQTEEPSSG